MAPGGSVAVVASPPVPAGVPQTPPADAGAGPRSVAEHRRQGVDHRRRRDRRRTGVGDDDGVGDRRAGHRRHGAIGLDDAQVDLRCQHVGVGGGVVGRVRVCDACGRRDRDRVDEQAECRRRHGCSHGCRPPSRRRRPTRSDRSSHHPTQRRTMNQGWQCTSTSHRRPPRGRLSTTRDPAAADGPALVTMIE